MLSIIFVSFVNSLNMRTIYVDCKGRKVEYVSHDDKINGIVVKYIDENGVVCSSYIIKGKQLEIVSHIICIPFEEKITFKTDDGVVIIPSEKWEIVQR